MKDSDKLFVIGISLILIVSVGLAVLSVLTRNLGLFIFVTPFLYCVLIQVFFLSEAWAREEREQKKVVWLLPGGS